jgi:hypothetical protein
MESLMEHKERVDARILDTEITVKDLSTYLRPGDWALTCNPQGLGKLIRFGEWLEEGDPANYGHALVFVHEQGQQDTICNGRTFESLSRIRHGHLKNYVGQNIAVVRHNYMTEKKYWLGYDQICGYDGMIYPFHRLPVHAVDMLQKFIWRKLLGKELPLGNMVAKHILFLKWPVCSVLVAEFFLAADLPLGVEQTYHGETVEEKARGINPDSLDDARINADQIYFETIFEGKLLA